MSLFSENNRVTVSDGICETVDQIIRRHEADYTRLYVELDELDDVDSENPRWVHTARWVCLLKPSYIPFNRILLDKIRRRC